MEKVEVNIAFILFMNGFLAPSIEWRKEHAISAGEADLLSKKWWIVLHALNLVCSQNGKIYSKTIKMT